ncbi:hypothetical protein CVT91_00610 [Candidatus Atribacteria bacterium HGW-Atribacteria-1]|nr:MAG: hypothetical protein CVT91_00610 [Candidatus Atribacteria bacterium HGW-Atribacteria-1]
MLPITISIVVPVYKVEKYIENCLISILQQSYRNIEIIVVDDGSPDKSMEIAEKLLKSSNNVYTVLKQKNQGVASARNVGIAIATGEWVITIDSDDWVNRELISKIVSCINDYPEAQAVFCDFQVVEVGEEDKKPQWSHGCKTYTANEAVKLFFKREAKLIAPALLVKKKFLQEYSINYDENCRFAEDDLFVWKVLACSEHVVYIREPLYNYVRHSGSTMTSSRSEKFFSGYTAARDVYSDFIIGSHSVGVYANAFLSRHVFGILHAAAKVLDYKSFKALTTKMDTKMLFQNISKLHQVKVKVLMKVFFFNIRLFYSIMRKF